MYERSRPFAVRHLALDLTLDVAQKSIDAVATLDVERIDASATEIRLDAVSFEIASVAVVDALEVPAGTGERPPQFVYDGNTLGSRSARDERHACASPTGRRRSAVSTFSSPTSTCRIDRVKCGRSVKTKTRAIGFPCHDKPHLKMTFELSAEFQRVVVPVERQAHEARRQAERQTLGVPLADGRPCRATSSRSWRGVFRDRRRQSGWRAGDYLVPRGARPTAVALSAARPT